MKIKLEGKEIEVISSDKNIVDVAVRSMIPLPAPCYRARQRKGCCHSCVVEIDGEQKFACSTAPEEGMDVVVDREYLKALRRGRLLKYQEEIKMGNPCECKCFRRKLFIKFEEPVTRPAFLLAFSKQLCFTGEKRVSFTLAKG